MKNFKNIFLGVILSTLLTCIFILIFSLILAKTNFNEKYINAVVVVITGVCILIGTTISTRKIEKNGAIIGVTTAFVYVVILYILSSIITNNFSISISSLIMAMLSVLVGGVGGIIGVNL